MKKSIIFLYLLFSLGIADALPPAANQSKNMIQASWKQIGPLQLPYTGDIYGRNPSIIFNPINNQLYVIYNYGGDIGIMKLKKNKWIQVGEDGFSNQDGSVTDNFSIILNSKTQELYTIYDYDEKLGQLYYYYAHGNNSGINIMKFNGKNWISIGKFNLAFNNSITLDQNNCIPYIAYNIYNSKTRQIIIKVMKFEDNKWLAVNKDLIRGQSPQIIFNNHDQQLYMVYQNTHNQAVVASFNNNKLVTLGKINIAPTPSIVITVESFSGKKRTKKSRAIHNLPAAPITLNPDTNELYMAYIANPDSAKTNKAIVIKFNKNTWKAIGKIELPHGVSPDNIKVYFNSVNKQPYIVYDYTESSSDQFVQIMTFNGSQWLNIGNPISIGDYSLTYLPSIAFSNTGELYMSYLNKENKIFVATFPDKKVKYN